MAVSDPALLTITEARRQIDSGRLSAAELTEAVLARTERLNPGLNAYLHVDREGALAAARAVDAGLRSGPLAGVPVCVKDNIDVAGMPTTAGAANWARTAERDAGAVARLRAAGAVIVGKGHTNEFAYGVDGRNPHWGDCRNPHDPERITGGSSSGPAAATASGLALAGLGTDTAGSIRVPASLCGLVGVRATFGRVPRDGVVPLAWSFDVVGPLTRSVADAAIMLEALTGGGTGVARADLTGVRLGLLDQLIEAADTYVAAAVHETSRALTGRGAHCRSVRLERLGDAPAIQQLIQSAEAAAAHAPWFNSQRERYSAPVRTRLEAGRSLRAVDYLTAQRARRLLIGEAAEAMRDLDALLAPSTPVIAPYRDAEQVTIRGVLQPLRPALLGPGLLASQLGTPAISVPAGEHAGCPFGVQIIGSRGSEPLLLQLAAACVR